MRLSTASLLITLTALLLVIGCLKQSKAERGGEGSHKPMPVEPDGGIGDGAKGPGDSDDGDGDGGDGTASRVPPQLSDAINQFAFRLYDQLRAEDGNLFFSPFSISTALSMVYEGAAGSTAQQIQSVIGFPQEAGPRRQYVDEMLTALNPGAAAYQLSVANGIWVQQDYALLPDFTDVLRDTYRSESTVKDFATGYEPARVDINQWVSDKTSGKIPLLFPEGTILPDTKLVLANAIYFKGLWARQFDPERSFDKEFRTPGGPVNATFMVPGGSDAEFGFFQDETLKVLELPYEGDDLSMVLLLPREDDLAALDSSLNPEALAALMGRLVMQEVAVQLPRFTFSSGFELKDTLSELGMPEAFTDSADFSGMTGGKDLKIGVVMHKAFVEVNEEGTEAAAATGITMRPTSAAMDPIEFVADHPFIFVIRDLQSNAILFMGRVEDPSA